MAISWEQIIIQWRQTVDQAQWTNHQQQQERDLLRNLQYVRGLQWAEGGIQDPAPPKPIYPSCLRVPEGM